MRSWHSKTITQAPALNKNICQLAGCGTAMACQSHACPPPPPPRSICLCLCQCLGDHFVTIGDEKGPVSRIDYV